MRDQQIITRTEQPSVTDAVERLVSAGEDMIAKRIDLALLEGKLIGQRMAMAASFGVVGFVVACVAWVALVYALVAAVLPDAPPALRAGLFGAINLVIGGGLLLTALHFGRNLNPIDGSHDNNRSHQMH